MAPASPSTLNWPSPKFSSVLVVPRQPSLVQAGQRHIVAHAGQVALGVDQLLRHDEQRDALHARNQLAVRPRDLGQHEVHDVLGQLVLARGDPHLVAAQAVARAERIVLIFQRGARGDVAQGRAGLRLAQTHGAGPAAVEFVGGEHLLLQLGAVHHQQVGVAHREQVGADADRRLAEEGVGGRFDDVRQLHAAVLVILRGGQHAGFGIGGASVVRGLRQHHAQAAIGLGHRARLFGIDQAVERRVLLARDALAGFHHRVEGLARMFGKARALRERRRVEPVVKQKVEGLAQVHRLPVLRTTAEQPNSRTQRTPRFRRERRKNHFQMGCGKPKAFVGLFGFLCVLCEFLRPLRPAVGWLDHSTSKMPAAPMPPPMHIVTATFLAPRRLPSMSAWPVRR